jgi:hypothetical protein
MHDDIKRFGQDGYADDNHVQNKEWLVRELETQMRDQGYVPCLDNEPQYTAHFVSAEKGFWFELSVYGIFVGKEDAWRLSGVTNGKQIRKHIPTTK